MSRGVLSTRLREIAGAILLAAFGSMLVLTGDTAWGWAFIIAAAVPLAITGLCDLVVFLAVLPQRIRTRQALRELRVKEAQISAAEADLALLEARFRAHRRVDPQA